jgi:predicted metal-binding protein
MTDEQQRLARRYADSALARGACDAVPFGIADICFDPRTLLKCMYGCPDWGKSHTCPSRPGNPSMDELRRMFERYACGIVIHTHDKALSQRISFAVEAEAYQDGLYFAFSLSDCAMCATCAGFEGKPCRFPHNARPAFHSVGIDVYRTVRNLGLPLYPLRDAEREEQNWYSAVFLE